MQAELRNHVRYVTLYRRRFNAEDQGRRGWKIWRAKSQRKWFTRVKVTPQDVEGWFPQDCCGSHTLPPSTNPLDALLPVLPTSQGAKNSQTSGLCSTRLRDSQAVPNCRRASP